MTVISLGAGVQSSTLFLMACYGELPKPDIAIFADTQAEPEHVYQYLEFLKKKGEEFNIPVHVVTRGSLKDDTLDYVEGRIPRVASIPSFTKNEGNEKEGRLWRQCTSEYKIMVVRKEIRRLLKEQPRKYKRPVHLWLGISTDEIIRMKDSNVKYITHHWPLIERGMSRQDCINWYGSKDFPAPARSACTFCPYRKNAEWAYMKQQDPQAFQDAVEFDRRIRNQPKLHGQAFIHRSLKPLDEIDFETIAGVDPGFGEECEGMCGI